MESHSSPPRHGKSPPHLQTRTTAHLRHPPASCFPTRSPHVHARTHSHPPWRLARSRLHHRVWLCAILLICLRPDIWLEQRPSWQCVRRHLRRRVHLVCLCALLLALLQAKGRFYPPDLDRG